MAPIHALGTAVELADLAWDAYEFRHRRKQDPYINTDQHQRCLDLKGALDHERSENQRLRAALEEYEKVVQQIQALSAEDSSVHMLPDSQSCPSDDTVKLGCKPLAKSTVARCTFPGNIFVLNNGYDSELYERLMKTVESPAFLEKIQVLQKNLKMDEPATMEVEGDILVNCNLDDASRWLWVTEDATLTKKEEMSSLDGENYIIVTEEDIVEGIALFMARIVAENPQSKNLSPEQLRSTISSTFANMKETNIIHKLLAAGKVMYTVASWGLALYGLYTQRHIVKAATKAVVKSGRVVLRAL